MKPDLDVLADLARYDSATISNAIETFDVRPPTTGYTDSTVRCMYPDLPPIVGRVVTCRFENSPETRTRPNRLPDLLDLVWETEEPVVVVAAHTGPDPERSSMVGDIVSAMLQRLGAVGIVTSCAARDLDVVRRRAPGFQIFARGVVASHGAGRVVEVDEEVTIGGLNLRPLDVVHADHNGVVAVPEEIAGSLAAAAQAVLEREESIQRRIHAPLFDYESVRDNLVH